MTATSPASISHATLTESPLFKGFEGWSGLPEDSVLVALREGMVVLDTNVLLGLYKYSPTVTRQWVDLLSALGDRLFLPHQVLLEFWRRRIALAKNAETTERAKRDIGSAASKITSGYEDWVRTRRSDLTEEDEQLLREQRDLAARMEELLQQAIDQHEQRFSAEPDKDEVVQLLQQLVDGGMTVGAPYDPEALEERYAIADERYANKIPPGFSDDANNKDAKNGKVTEKKYGDYLLWAQTLDEARKRGAEEVVLVTDDLKEDWWERRRDTPQRSLPDLRPHHLLVEEMASEAAARYVQLTRLGFIETAAAALSVEVSDEARKMAAASIDSPASTTWYITAYGRTKATAVLQPDRSMVLKAGSLIPRTLSSSIGNYAALHANLVASDAVVDDGDERSLRLVKDVPFSSPSAAATVVQGSNTNGNIRWTNDAGITLGTFLSETPSDPEDTDE